MPTLKINLSELPPEVMRARKGLARKGYSYRQAAPLMGVGYQHLCMVLTGRRESRRLLQAIKNLPAQHNS